MKEINYFLSSILDEQMKNQTFMLVLATNAGKVISTQKNSFKTDCMLADMARDNSDTYISIYDSRKQGKKELEEALSYSRKNGYKIVGNTKWIPRDFQPLYV